MAGTSIFVMGMCAILAGRGQTHYVPTDFTTIQSAINASRDGDTILVEPGIYAGDGNRDISFYGKKVVLRSVSGPEMTVIDSQGSPLELHGGFRLIHNETNETAIDGFTITGGYLIGNTGGYGPSGGGGGAGIFIRRSSPTIRNCIIRDNRADRIGSNFVHDGLGAGIFIDEASLAVIENCIIRDNHGGNRGGGIAIISFLSNDTRVIIRNCLIENNTAIPAGGGIYTALATTDILNTNIIGNEASLHGGALLNEQSQTLVSNCIIWGNAIEEHIRVVGVGLTVQYSIVEDGVSGIDAHQDPVFEWGPGNKSEDPLFEKGDSYRLSRTSPGVDAGSPVYVGPEEDLVGEPRIQNHRVDMGAIESDHVGTQDCNNNDVPDSLEIGLGEAEDCNHNGFPDECDLLVGVSDDANGDSIPDECPVYILVSTDPPDGAMDARQPTSLDGSESYGWDRVQFEFFSDVPKMAPGDFEVYVSGGDPPEVASVSVDGSSVVVVLDRPISPGECTTVQLVGSDVSVSMLYHPGNTNDQAGVNSGDILGLIDQLNGQHYPPMDVWQCDLNRSGACEPSDILRLIDVMMGAESYERWVLVPTPVCP